MSALEAYDTQKRGLGPVDEETFKKQRGMILAAAESGGLTRADRKFLKRWLPRRSSFSLEERLRDLKAAPSGINNWTVDPRRMAEIRNDIAHGNADVPESELHDVYDQAFDLARRTVLHELRLD